MTRQGATLSELCAEDDPRWKLAYSEAFGPLPELSSFSKLEFRSWALFRQHEIKVIYDLGIPDASPLSFRSNEWRSAVPGAGSAPVKPVRWDSDRFADFWNRIVYYQIQIHYGSGLDSRQVVRALAESRREWQAQRTVEHAKWLRDRHLNHAKRHLTRLKAEVMKAGGPCTYCGVANPRTVDHVVPTSRGGPDRPRNLVIACKSCNSQKSNRTPEEWRADRLTAGQPWPPLPTPQNKTLDRTSA